jgi:murein DD-endopeptidase MepM/ murein hydrolase activator NlpD
VWITTTLNRGSLYRALNTEEGIISTFSSKFISSVESVQKTTTTSIKQYQRTIVSPAGFFMVLTMFVIGWNCFQVDQDRFALAAAPDQALVEVDPGRTNAILASIDQYTPLLQESDALVEETPFSMIQGFVVSQISDHPFVTEPTRLEQSYLVADGDTITGIAGRYGLHVATIAERNGIKLVDIEKIKPGTTLTIPPSDTSDSTDWLVQLNEKKEADRQQAIAEANRQQKLKLATSRATTKSVSGQGFDRVASMDFIIPIGYRAIARRLQRDHFGIDFDAPIGTPVKAAQDGRVVEVTGGWAGGFGNSILVDHGGGVTTRYAHLSQVNVSVGDTVSQGQVIGHSGNTGFSTGPHLHFETRVNGRAVDPFH